MTAEQGETSGKVPWGSFTIPRDVPLRFHLGSVTLLLLKEGDEIRIATISEDGEDPPGSTTPGTVAWARWATTTEEDSLEILPSFPDRPLVLRPDDSFRLLPGAEARIYVRVPVWVRIRVGGKTGSTIMEVPSVTLSDTWWGDPQSGELGYWLHVVARRSTPPEIFQQDRIICPVELVNRSREELPVEKILLRCEHLSIFQGTDTLWSDETRVSYRGEEIGSELEVTGRTPREAPRAPRLSPPRVPIVRGFTARTFARLRGFSGLGGSSSGDSS